MKKIICTVFALVVLSAALFAGLAVPGEANPILAKEEFELDGQKLTAEKRIDNMNLTIRVIDAAGKTIFTSETLGSEEKLFVIDREAKSLEVRDLNGDGSPELIAAAFYGPNASGMYVFSYDSKAGKFKPMQFIHPESELVRNCLVSDLRQDNGEDLMFLDNNIVRALGMIYSSEPEVAPVAGFYFYKLSDGAFKFIESKPVPVDE
jgi:hypothetical protein